jgi:hypothetical protein
MTKDIRKLSDAQLYALDLLLVGIFTRRNLKRRLSNETPN